MKNKGSFLIVTGLFLILLSLLLLYSNLTESTQAGEEAAAVAQKLTQELPKTPEISLEMPVREMPEVEIDGNAYIGVLEIPALSRTLPVMSDWSYSKLRTAPCRYRGSAYEKNFIIMAHNYASHFGSLKDLSMGESIVFTDVDGNVFEYEVVEMEILEPFMTNEMEAGEWDLTLFTCTLGGQSRVTVRCMLK